MSRVLCVTQTVPVVPCYLSVSVGNQLDYMGSSLSPLFTGKEKRSYCAQDVFHFWEIRFLSFYFFTNSQSPQNLQIVYLLLLLYCSSKENNFQRLL